jgi:predicted ATPase
VLYGREAECALIDSLIARAAEAHSGVLVLRGEPGIGKSALLDYAIEKRAFCHLLRGEVSNPRCSCRTQHSTNCCIPS